MATTAALQRPVPKRSAQPSRDHLKGADAEIVHGIRTALRSGRKKADPLRLAELAGIAFVQEFPVEKADHRLANALARGITVRRTLVEAEGGNLSAESAAREIGISKAAILKRYQKGRLVAWREERQNAVRFPVWQFQDHRVLDGLEEVLRILQRRPLDDFGRMLFFLSKMSFLRNRRPLDCLRAGAVDKVLQAADAYGG